MEPSRYTSVFSENMRKWRVKDRQTGSEFGDFDTKRQSDRRATQLQTLHNKKRQDYGMRYAGPAPSPRSYKD